MGPSAYASVDEPLELSGSVRTRYEALSGQPRTTFKDGDQWISIRSSFLAKYDAGDGLRFAAQLTDSRAYLADRRSAISTNEVNTFEFTEAYVAKDYREPFGRDSLLTLRAGRMSLDVGSRRLVAAEDYRNTSNSVTGVKADVKLGSRYTGTAFYTFPQTRLPDDLTSVLNNDTQWDLESSAVVLYGASVQSPHRLFGGALEATMVEFRERDAPGRPTRDRALRTLDLRTFRDASAGHWDWEVELASQDGRARTTTIATAPMREVAASFAHGRVGYEWDLRWKPRLALEYDWVSGEGRGGESHRFDTLLGMRRSDFAPSGLYNLVGRANISSPGLRFEAAPSPRLDLMATFRGLWLADRRDAFSTIGIKDSTGRSGSFAGTQVDTRARYWLVPAVLRFEFDGVVLFKGRFLEEAPNARHNGDARFLSLNLQVMF